MKKIIVDQSMNSKIILNVLRNEKKLNRKQLSEKTNMKMTTIYDNLSKLERLGFVTKACELDGTRGRPPVFWTITEKGMEWIKKRRLKNEIKC